MGTRKFLAASIGMVLAAQATLTVAKLLGWQPVAQHGWLTLAWFPVAFYWGSGALAAVMLLVGMAFSRSKWRRNAWVAEEPQLG